MNTVFTANMELLTRPTTEILGHRLGMAALLEVPRDELATVLTGFNDVVGAYNQLDDTKIASHRHLARLKPELPYLLTPETLLRGSSTRACSAFRQALRTMGTLMERAESGEPEPSLGFAIWPDTNLQERFLGGVLQAYGLTISHASMGEIIPEEALPDFYKRKDVLLDALLEVSAQEHSEGRDSLLFNVSRSQGWFDARDGDGFLFTNHTRTLAAP